jgi:hypothetical protein
MRLPVSGLEVRYRVPNGKDELAIIEASGNVLERALAALPRLAALEDGDAMDWETLTVTDFEVCLLGLRQSLLGDTLSCAFRCSSCAERMDVEVSIAAFLADIHPSMPRRVKKCSERNGWFAFEDAAGVVLFRPISVADQVNVMGRGAAADLLAERCIEARGTHARSLRRVEKALEAMAPVVSRPLVGHCAACGELARMTLHVPALVMQDLRMAAAGVYSETHAIAGAYHWPEATILEMPQTRRHTYAEMIRQAAA